MKVGGVNKAGFLHEKTRETTPIKIGGKPHKKLKKSQWNWSFFLGRNTPLKLAFWTQKKHPLEKDNHVPNYHVWVPAVNSSSVYWILTQCSSLNWCMISVVHQSLGAFWYKNNRDPQAHVLLGWSSKMGAVGGVPFWDHDVLGLCSILNSLPMVCFMGEKQFLLFGAHVLCLCTWNPLN